MSRSAKGFGQGLWTAREHFEDPHALHSLPKGVAVDVVAIAEDVGGRGVVGEGLHELPCGPGRRGMLGHVEVDEAPTMVGEHDEDEDLDSQLLQLAMDSGRAPQGIRRRHPDDQGVDLGVDGRATPCPGQELHLLCPA